MPGFMFMTLTKGFTEMCFSRRNDCFNATTLNGSSFSDGFFNDGGLLFSLGLFGLRHLARGSILQEDDDHDLQSSQLHETRQVGIMGNLQAQMAIVRAARLVKIHRRPSISLFPSLFSDTVIL